MRELELFQADLARKVASYLGDDSRQPRGFAGQIRLIGQEAAILALPDVPDSAMDLQVMDPTSSFFGRRRFLAGVSSLSGTDVVF